MISNSFIFCDDCGEESASVTIRTDIQIPSTFGDGTAAAWLCTACYIKRTNPGGDSILHKEGGE